MISYVTAVDCILHCSDKNVVLTTSVAGAQARLSQYLCNMITFKSSSFFHLTGCSAIKTICTHTAIKYTKVQNTPWNKPTRGDSSDSS